MLGKHPSPKSTPLLIAIGNDGRNDDGLGWAFGHRVEKSGSFSGPVVYRYQLQVEDAWLMAAHPWIIFVDACREPLKAGFDLSAIQPAARFSYTTHQMAPQTVLALAKDLYGAVPEAFLLRIKGEAWELNCSLSAVGRENLRRATEGFSLWIGNFGEFPNKQSERLSDGYSPPT